MINLPFEGFIQLESGEVPSIPFKSSLYLRPLNTYAFYNVACLLLLKCNGMFCGLHLKTQEVKPVLLRHLSIHLFSVQDRTTTVLRHIMKTCNHTAE